jgi:signal transduction histidine kinase/DNA-binding response OmpR family regulator
MCLPATIMQLQTPPLAHEASRPPVVLAADDERSTTSLLRHIFERAGYSVRTANDGPAALDIAVHDRPDLILLDILMPGMNGFEVLQKLRDDPRTASIPTIMLTANAKEPADVARGLGLGADDYVYKPFVPQELLARAQAKIRSRKLEEALFQRTRELEQVLQASEYLNQHLEPRQVLALVAELVTNLLPVEYVAVVSLDDDGHIEEAFCWRAGVARPGAPVAARDLPTVAAIGATHHEPQLWHQDPALVPPFGYGIALPLRHSGSPIGTIVAASERPCLNENSLRLLTGVARQATLALRNAQLYQILSNYAVRLEDMVSERTAELESAQKLLIRTEKLASIGHLAASIAHEINNPLMPITNLLANIIEELDEQHIEYDRKAVQIIHESLERIRSIVLRLLDFSRDRGSQTGVIDVNEVLENVIVLNRNFFAHEHIAIQSELGEIAPIHGSKDQLEQVFMNIALNGAAAMPDGGVFTIRSYMHHGMVAVELTDTGVGIPPESLDKIFDPFYSTKPNGTGLGLFVSYSIIEAHHGRIEVRNNKPRGTTFTIFVPALHPANAGSPT